MCYVLILVTHVLLYLDFSVFESTVEAIRSATTLFSFAGLTVVANTLAKWKKFWSQMELTLAKVLARE